MIVVVVATVFNFILNAYAIPRYGIIGAAVVSLITNIIVGIGYVVACRFSFRVLIVDFRRCVLFALMMLTAYLLWQIRTIPFWYTAPLAVAFYVFVSYYFGFTKEEREFAFAQG
jgi:O-antigen/teichoic acid export membrane protein